MKKTILLTTIVYAFALVLIPTASVDNYSILRKVGLFIFAVSLLVYYLKSNKRNMLVTASIATDNKFEEKGKNNRSDISFKDVAGLDEIKDELEEIIAFFNNHDKFNKMGAKIPSGVLFYGPPGTGKTLLAKALAGEANSNFLYSSGSEFVEKYVGIGAKRVRSLFEKARKDSPTIIFIDEIDAIGTRRNSDSNNEKDQTLNQLLIEMDGFNKDKNVVVIGATNRLDLLDEALLRPGRFDRHIYVGNPNANSRVKILDNHTKNKPLHSNVNISDIARKTHGFSSAQLANIVNEAAIIAVRNNKDNIDNDDFNAAIERIVAGLELKNPSVLEKERKVVAYHEAGHALVGKLLSVDMIQKVSIIPRGQALGYVLKLPDEERYLLTQVELLNKIKVLLGGRVTEKVMFNEVTTGAKDDLEKATEIAHQMVCNYGMSSIGNISIKKEHIEYSFKEIDREVKYIINSCFKETLTIIEQNKDLISRIADYLIQNETMTGDELDLLVENFNTEKLSNIV
ncbi:ATP-dependent metalloprotease FtsH [Gottschalkia acidurici 9a]|uniref:ATP-dependent zinc metalloprotease FtsH n=1 Tax=Gottschalkia acidurici (strain ATCC 7906 / DSM 604 / BCRC 14475 / CIP 104303 / KCTC 5404 / NCIMB 10678 / 9a) TaxID=1128398 RepID=K0AYR7_GOTA9|nr:AAA family ATPase [Gottschalkia acidurici]AFS77922.1 ATP-dependent metalloprotease FtsH [Gottschalkia acidurici 9a]